ncbi:hypothetical protein A2690_02940 [Candidatus Roizmanbacteria bacterium RIFCSPHIGHO2_01_FULL_39_12b]|uniref:PIN domain-containing protein n=1 Tax=Candidatus Roizmanbacteria bacterium RIFCSPHIGHO2_01_FULL_39_12b TaxID=1802030 RepID=A0A1F7G8T2_9BACT|nr:MAG: hypothetical protein A2690_02940 [Candidatus Roizmanbacteria bacterium RIFCSPHIGHO2_01_FULL_39_12b]OGK45936.1 MAG: hypothetical protein A3B46_02750 [Candidatus Roizmanbacteria bacterium RIFCSPLOWO2_01_FULL_39_19]
MHKIKIPNKKLSSFIDDFTLIDLDKNIINKFLKGPTNDLKDNIHLHSAAEEDCDIFLTFDKKLLAMRFFGKAQIMSPTNFK